MFTRFADRADGGRRLAALLDHYARQPDTIVLGLPRGGVVTAAAVAGKLELPLDVLVVRKLGMPGREELAMGAIGPGGVRILDPEVIAATRVSAGELEEVTAREQIELARRERLYRAGLPPLDLAGRNVILIDDGLATGSTMEAAVAVVQAHRPARIVIAVPVAPGETYSRLARLVHEVVCVASPEPFHAVGEWYGGFAQVTDGEVIDLLARARARAHAPMRM